MKRVQAILVMALLLVGLMAAAAQAHVHSEAVQDCDGWSYSVSFYNTAGDNSIQVWIDGDLITDIADFGANAADSGTWVDESASHTLRVKVDAWDDPTGSRGFSFDTTLTAVGCATTTTSTSTTTTSTSTTTTTMSPTTTQPPGEIGIEKSADPVNYGKDLIAYFTITVTNTGDVPLTNVAVSDDIAAGLDPGTNCVNPSIGDLAPDESFTYSCSVANMPGGPWTNVAIATGIDTSQNTVTATDDAQVLPLQDVTVTTQPPTTEPSTTVAPTSTTPTETLPVTGVDSERLQGFGLVGVSLVGAGLILLGGAALVGRMREDR